MTQHTDSTTQLRTHLAQIADLLVEHGTDADARRLTELSRAVQHVAPGAAAALVDRTGSEVSRLRAFAVASAAVLRLSATAHAQVVERFDGTSTALTAA